MKQLDVKVSPPANDQTLSSTCITDICTRAQTALAHICLQMYIVHSYLNLVACLTGHKGKGAFTMHLQGCPQVVAQGDFSTYMSFVPPTFSHFLIF